MDLILKFVQVGTNLIKVLLDIGIYLDKKKEKKQKATTLIIEDGCT